MAKDFILAVDFDGTIVEHYYPDIGPEAPGAFKWLKKLQRAGAKLILWTMRSDGRKDGTNPLDEAVTFCRDNGLVFWDHNQNPEQNSWTDSPKVYAHAYIDDAAYGCPLIPGTNGPGRGMVDWEKAGPELLKMIKAHK